MNQPITIKIDEIEYVRKDQVRSIPAVNTDGQPYVIIRSHGAGVFAGYLRERNDETRVVMLDICQRLWRWTGATLSQVARDGTAGSGENRFSIPVDGHAILQVIEIIPATERARVAISEVKPWEI